ncbi:FAD-linked oxidoreductase [Trametopsis cervina]|nr:FAD-linked oxidoreductase [Trametopsis cervina]
MMSTRLLLRTTYRIQARPWARNLSSRPSTPQWSYRRLTAIGLSGVVLASSLAVTSRSTVYADAEESTQSAAGPTTPLSSFVRSYVVYAMCSIPPLVDWSPTILSTCLSIPIVKTITESFVRVTFFDQFVGAETAEGAVPLLERFRTENKGCLFAYSVEVDEAAAAGKAKQSGKAVQPIHKQIVQEMIHSIDVAADFEDKHKKGASQRGRRTWVAIKLTALVPDHHVLTTLSRWLVKERCGRSPIAFPGAPQPTELDILDRNHSTSSILSQDDIRMLKDLRDDLDSICQHASERGVRIIIDAEHSWYQPAIDAFALSLMRKFNRLSASSDNGAVQPLVYNTFQAYLRRNPEYLAHSLRAAKEGGYALGVKLVRGAYHPHEIQAHTAKLSISPDSLPPVWPVKSDTDDCYNACAEVLLDAIADDIAHPPASSFFGRWFGSSRHTESTPTVGVLFGTHNWKSCKLILDGLVKRGLAQVEGVTLDGEPTVRIADEVTERLTLGQLYGMHDNLTEYLVNRTRTTFPCVIKYVPYGSLKEVMPYLSRRAIENKSVLGEGAAVEERKRAWEGIRARLF